MPEKQSFISTTRYFWRNWRPLLGNSLAVLIIEARQRCYHNRKSGESRNWFYSSMGELAGAVGFGIKKTINLLKQPHASKFITYKQTYRYDPAKGKRIKGKCFFQVSLTDPLTPDDEAKPLRQNIHSDVSKREQPTGQNNRKVSHQSERPTCRNSLNIYNTINNINISATATTNNNIITNEKKGEQNYRSRSEQKLIKAVRKTFKNRISERKIVELIEKTGLENVVNQLKWLPHRDNSWARNGPVVAFIVYCEQQLEEPETLKARQRNELIAEEQNRYCEAEKDSFHAMTQRDFAARRARYSNPEQYDDLFRQLIEKLEPCNSLARSLLQSSFIGDIKTNGSHKTAIIDVPNGFSGNFLQSRISGMVAVNSEYFKLEFIHQSAPS